MNSFDFHHLIGKGTFVNWGLGDPTIDQQHFKKMRPIMILNIISIGNMILRVTYLASDGIVEDFTVNTEKFVMAYEFF